MSLLSRLTRKKANWGRNSLGVSNYVVDSGAQALFDKAQIMGRDGTLSWTRASTEIGYPEIFGAKTATANNPVSKELPCGLTMVQVDGARTALFDPDPAGAGWVSLGGTTITTPGGNDPTGNPVRRIGAVATSVHFRRTSNIIGQTEYAVAIRVRAFSGAVKEGLANRARFSLFNATLQGQAAGHDTKIISGPGTVITPSIGEVAGLSTTEWTTVVVSASGVNAAHIIQLVTYVGFSATSRRPDAGDYIEYALAPVEAGSFPSSPKAAVGAFSGSEGIWSFDTPINTAARSIVAFGIYGTYDAATVLSAASNHTFWWNATGLVAAGNLNLNADFGIAVDNNFLPAVTGQDATITPFQPFCLASIADGTTHTAILNGGVATVSEPNAAPYSALNYLSVGSFDGAASQFLYGAEALAVFDYAITALDVSRMYRQFLREAFLT